MVVLRPEKSHVARAWSARETAAEGCATGGTTGKLHPAVTGLGIKRLAEHAAMENYATTARKDKAVQLRDKILTLKAFGIGHYHRHIVLLNTAVKVAAGVPDATAGIQKDYVDRTVLLVYLQLTCRLG